MKKCYTFTLLCLLGSFSLYSQTRYWVGPGSGSGSNWNNTANWSATSGGAGGASVPNGGSFDVIFNQDAVVNVDISSLGLNSIKVTNSQTAILYTSDNTTITVSSTSGANPAIDVDAGSILKDSVTDDVVFSTEFAPNALGEIDGDWIFSGDPAITGDNGAVLSAFEAGIVVNVNATGRIIIGKNGFIDATTSTPGPSTINFLSGSYLIFTRNGGTAPNLNYHANSTIRITGITTTATAIQGSPASIGHLEIDCPNMAPEDPVTGLTLGINGTSEIKGNLKVLNTNNERLALAVAAAPASLITLQGNLEISGTSYLRIANGPNTYTLQVNGNYVQTGGTFSIQDDNNTSLGTTTLALKGNFSQTAGTFTANSTANPLNSNYFVLEMNGTSAQTLSASSGTIDNANHQVALKLNNSAGVTLNSPLQVGRMHFATGNITTTNINLLTINNADNNSFTTQGAGSGSYVNGPVKRRTELALQYLFPTGKGGVYHEARVVPSSTTASEYTTEYFNAAYSDLSVIAPLTGVSNTEYWEIARNSGSGASVLLTLNAAVNGATATDAVVVARYNGVDWVNEKGSTGTMVAPGNSNSGQVISQDMTSFSPFTFGYGPAVSLPIKLRSFSAEKENGFNVLHWQADCYSTEVVFEIERSYDGKNFSKIATIVADQARCRQPFDYKDASTGQTVYYRIRVVDVDGTGFYSRIAVLIYNSKGFEIVGVYPTVVTSSQLKVNISAAANSKVEFYITNTPGQIMKRIQANVQAGENIITLNVQELRAGNYQLTGFNSDGEVRTFRFIKE